VKSYFFLSVYILQISFFLYESLLAPYAIMKEREKEKEKEKERDTCKILLNKII